MEKLKKVTSFLLSVCTAGAIANFACKGDFNLFALVCLVIISFKFSVEN